MEQGSDEKNKSSPPAGRQKRLAVRALYLLLLVCAIFAALKIHKKWVEPHVSPVSAEPKQPNSLYPAVPQSIKDYRDPMAMEGWRSLGGDENPGGIPPPAGAKMAYGYQYPSVDSVVRQAIYEYSGRREDISTHYKSQMESRGFKFLGMVPRSGSGQQMVFQKKSTEASVLLPIAAKKGKIEYILIVTEQVENQSR